MTYSTSTAYTDLTDVVMSDGTVAQISDMISRSWTWQPPKPLLTIHEQISMPMVTTPYIPMRWHKPFMGHKFGIGRGSKKR